MKTTTCLLAAFLLTAAPVTVSRADPPPWAPAHGYRAKYDYVYYPQREIYYAPASGMWFWLDGGDWQVGVNLPGIYQPYVTSGVRLQLESDRPYREHAHVVEYYGGRSKGGKSAKAYDHDDHPGRGGESGKGHDKGKGKHKD